MGSTSYVKYIGGTTKAAGGFAGQFGEGFKICALVALRDFHLRVFAGAGDWRIEPMFVPVSLGEELVYKFWKDADHPGTFLELHGCNAKLLDLFAAGKQFFHCSGNANLGERLFSDGVAHIYRSKCSPGEVYYCKQLRGDVGYVPFTVCMDAPLDNIRRDRDRRRLAPKQIRIVVGEVAERVPFDVGIAIVNDLQSCWEHGGHFLDAFVGGLYSAHHKRFKDKWPASFPATWVAREQAHHLRYANEHARRVGLKLATSALASIGMRPARELADSDVRAIDEAEITAVDRARVDLLIDGARHLYPSERPLPRLVHMRALGEYRRGEILLEFDLLRGGFAEALATYVHELCHAAGKDGDARFSDELTQSLGLAIHLGDRMSELKNCWAALAEMDASEIGRCRKIADIRQRVDALVRVANSLNPKAQP